MGNAGDYRHRLAWGRRFTNKDALGQDVEWYMDIGHLWCEVTEDSGSRTQDDGAAQDTATATIRVRGYPTLSAQDQLTQALWPGGSTVWSIDGVRRGTDELIVTATRRE